MSLVNKPAPDFIAPAVIPDGTINESFQSHELRGRYVVLFFWPMDFTFVCPSEIIAHDNRFDEFRARGAEIVGISIDSVYVHHAWRNTPREKGGIGAIRFPIISDITHTITRSYNVEHEDGVALRASFLIDREGIVQHEVVNNLALGRDVDEMLRMLNALQFCEQHGEVCPAGWHQGEEGILPTPEGVADYLGKHARRL
jgi:peroxiredoxin (alkyl hydroperoxide reductase subunit C)